MLNPGRISCLKSPPSPLSTTISHLCLQTRPASSRWAQRQAGDHYVRNAKLQGLKSRAAFKLLDIDKEHRIFSRGNIVVDLGYAPGSWSQIAKERVGPYGIVVGIDLIPNQPPPGVSTIQGNFLHPWVQEMAKTFITEAARKKGLERQAKMEAEEERKRAAKEGEEEEGEGEVREVEQQDSGDVVLEQASYIEAERLAARDAAEAEAAKQDTAAKTAGEEKRSSETPKDKPAAKMVSVVLSDMSAPWPQTHGFSINSLSNPYRRMMNTSGNRFRDQAGSMRLCNAAVQFASEVLKPGGHFVCKYYQGPDDQELLKKLKFLFKRVSRVKPQSSRDESMEGFFVAKDRKAHALIEDYEASLAPKRSPRDESSEEDWE